MTILRLYGEAFVNFWSSFRTCGNNNEPIPSHVSFANSAWEYLLPVLLRRSTGGCPVDLAQTTSLFGRQKAWCKAADECVLLDTANSRIEAGRVVQ